MPPPRAADRTQLDTLSTTGAPIVTMVDSYDAVGNRAHPKRSWARPSRQRTRAGGTGYISPAFQRREDGNPPLTMTFDADNRITTILQGSTLTTVTSDANGNPVLENANGLLTTLSYDDENRLTGIQFPQPGGRSTYTYSGDGLRRTAQEAAGGALTTMVWDGDDYLMENTPTGTHARYSVVDGEVITERRSGTRRLYVPDPLGSTRGLINDSQVQTDTFSYWPYGESQSRTGSTGTPFQFVGTLGYHLDASGNVYVRARYLDVARGRWLERDPLWPDEAGYMYGEDAPVDETDESGTQPGACVSCHQLMQQAARRACAAFGSKAAQKCAASCVKDSYGGGGLGRRMACEAKWCKHPKTRQLPRETAGCNVPGLDTCALTPPGAGVKCVIGVCPDSCPPHGPPFCNSDRERCITILHELQHCCQTGKAEGPAEAVAQCIVHPCHACAGLAGV